MFGRANGDVIIVEPEVDVVAWFDAELVSQLLWDDDLSFGTDAVSHTVEYNHESGAINARPTELRRVPRPRCAQQAY